MAFLISTFYHINVWSQITKVSVANATVPPHHLQKGFFSPYSILPYSIFHIPYCHLKCCKTPAFRRTTAHEFGNFLLQSFFHQRHLKNYIAMRGNSILGGAKIAFKERVQKLSSYYLWADSSPQILYCTHCIVVAFRSSIYLANTGGYQHWPWTQIKTKRCCLIQNTKKILQILRL